MRALAILELKRSNNKKWLSDEEIFKFFCDIGLEYNQAEEIKVDEYRNKYQDTVDALFKDIPSPKGHEKDNTILVSSHEKDNIILVSSIGVQKSHFVICRRRSGSISLRVFNQFAPDLLETTKTLLEKLLTSPESPFNKSSRVEVYEAGGTLATIYGQVISKPSKFFFKKEKAAFYVILLLMILTLTVAIWAAYYPDKGSLLSIAPLPLATATIIQISQKAVEWSLVRKQFNIDWHHSEIE